MCLPQADPGQNAGRYTCNLPLTVYPQQQIVLTPKEIAELGRKDMVLLWKVQVSLVILTFTSPYCSCLLALLCLCHGARTPVLHVSDLRHGGLPP